MEKHFLIDKITENYKKYLNRNPDIDGLEYHLKEIVSGRIKLEDLPEIFKESTEYKMMEFFRGVKNHSLESIFTEIYKKNIWLGKESRSGPGSDLAKTEVIRKELPGLFKNLGITTLLDIPCGDFNWLKEVDLSFLFYIGADIVDDLVSLNNTNYSNKNRIFRKLDITKDNLPKVDLILCKDLFQHLSLGDIDKTIKNIKKSKPKFLLATSDIYSKENIDKVSGSIMPFNLLLPPFSFPKPRKIIVEKHIERGYRRGHLLWSMDDIDTAT